MTYLFFTIKIKPVSIIFEIKRFSLQKYQYVYFTQIRTLIAYGYDLLAYGYDLTTAMSTYWHTGWYLDTEYPKHQKIEKQVSDKKFIVWKGVISTILL